MKGYIDDYDFGEMDPMRYYAPPSSWSDQKKKETARNRIFSGEFYGAEKKDGYFAKLIKDEDGTILLYSRSRGVNGTYADKHEWVPHLAPFFEKLPVGTCLLGELYLPSQPGSRNVTAILGCLKEKAIARQDHGEKLQFYAFDMLAWDGQSYLGNPAKHRFNNLHAFMCGQDWTDYVTWAHYCSGQDLWNLLQTTLESGGEGIVITHRDAFYEPGKRPSKTTLKIKQELRQTIDCFFTGRVTPPTEVYSGKEIENWQYWQDLRTGEKKCGSFYGDWRKGAMLEPVTKGWFYGWAGSLEIGVLRRKEGNNCTINGITYENMTVFPFGYLSGLPEEVRANPIEYAMRPIEVNAMSIDFATCSLRHGKMIGWRDDLSLADCTYDKIMEV